MLSDQEPVNLAGDRDEAAVRAITQRYNRRLFRIAGSIRAVTQKLKMPVLKTPGTFDYFCKIHLNMTGRMIVAP